MIPTITRAFGTITERQQLAEFYLTLASRDAVVCSDAAGLADISTWFDPQDIADPYFRAIVSRLLALQKEGGPADASTITKGLLDCKRAFSLMVMDIGNLILDSSMQRAHLRFYASEVLREHRRRGAAVDIVDTLDQHVDGMPFGALVTVGARTFCGESVFLGQVAL